MLRAMILSAEALLERHLDTINRNPNPEQDYEVFDLREVITDAKQSLAGPNKDPDPLNAALEELIVSFLVTTK